MHFSLLQFAIISVALGVLLVIDASTMVEMGRAYVPISVPFGFHNRFYSKRELGLPEGALNGLFRPTSGSELRARPPPPAEATQAPPPLPTQPRPAPPGPVVPPVPVPSPVVRPVERPIFTSTRLPARTSTWAPAPTAVTPGNCKNVMQFSCVKASSRQRRFLRKLPKYDSLREKGSPGFLVHRILLTNMSSLPRRLPRF